jgi:hypothetical protein
MTFPCPNAARESTDSGRTQQNCPVPQKVGVSRKFPEPTDSGPLQFVGYKPVFRLRIGLKYNLGFVDYKTLFIDETCSAAHSQIVYRHGYCLQIALQSKNEL